MFVGGGFNYNLRIYLYRDNFACSFGLDLVKVGMVGEVDFTSG